MRNILCLTFLLMTLLVVAQPCVAVDIVSSNHLVGAKAPGAFVPYKSSHPVDVASDEIRRIIISIHSSGFDANQYFENAQAAADAKGVLAETLIIAPQFLQQQVVGKATPDNMVFWRVSPFRESGRAAIGPQVQPLGMSAFEIIDDWLTTLTAGNLFPQLTDVVLVGHSGGGQFVQRYAMVGKYEPPRRVKIRYVVSAPSSYAYPTGKRYNVRSEKFVNPAGAALRDCPGYNSWGYGLNGPYGYFRNVPSRVIVSRYAKRHVFYLCGSRDNDPNDGSIGKSCGAMMQGRHRLERMQVFKAFLIDEYGKSIEATHRFAIVQGMGHYGKGNMTSPHGLSAMFGPLP